jgi:hypothetical protein
LLAAPAAPGLPIPGFQPSRAACSWHGYATPTTRPLISWLPHFALPCPAGAAGDSVSDFFARQLSEAGQEAEPLLLTVPSSASASAEAGGMEGAASAAATAAADAFEAEAAAAGVAAGGAGKTSRPPAPPALG